MEQRPLRFRAWDMKHKRMLEDVTPGTLIYFGNRDSHGFTHQANYQDCVVMQFTGLQDKNGIPIFESDVVNDRFGQATVSWDRVGWHPFHYNGGGEMTPEECEVVGNIYEQYSSLPTS